MKKLKEILNNIEILEINGSLETEISFIQYDSRKCTESSVFVAIIGTQSDGHNYINQAIEKGAIVVIYENQIIDKNNNITYIRVKNSRASLAMISKNYYDNPSKDMNIIAITGTNGKTTSTFLIKQILENADEKTGIIGTTGIYLGTDKIPATHTTPESLELNELLLYMKNHNAKNVVMETSSHALDQHRADDINYKAAIFTNLTLDHLDYHKTIENYAIAKKKLFDMLNEDSIAIIFDNSEYSKFMIQDCKAKQKYFIGRNDTSDIIIKNEVLNIDYSYFDLEFKNNSLMNLQGTYHFKTGLLGRFNIDNASASVALALLLNYPIEKISSAIANATGAPGRMQKSVLKNNAIGIVDYAHTPDALEKAILACRNVLISCGNANGKVICVFGCGGDRDRSKRPIMGKIASELSDIAIITDDNPRTELSENIILDIFIGIPQQKKQFVEIIPNRHEAIVHAVSLSSANDIVLIAGKGHEDYQIIGTTKHYFDDAAVLREL